MITLENACIAASLVAALWFILSWYRLRRAGVAREKYLRLFADACNNDEIPLDMLNKLQLVFQQSCGYCASVRIIVAALQQFGAQGNDTADPKLAEAPLTSRTMLAQSGIALFQYVSYYAPFLGFFVRRALSRMSETLSDPKSSRILWDATDHLTLRRA